MYYLVLLLSQVICCFIASSQYYSVKITEYLLFKRTENFFLKLVHHILSFLSSMLCNVVQMSNLWFSFLLSSCKYVSVVKFCHWHKSRVYSCQEECRFNTEYNLIITQYSSSLVVLELYNAKPKLLPAELCRMYFLLHL